MKISQATYIAVVVGIVDAKSLRSPSLLNREKTEAAAAAAVVAENEPNRELQGVGCNDDPNPAAAWHPTRPNGSWPDGFCTFTVDCNSPSYDTELECCNAAFAGQVSGVCLASLPSPPTTSPTDTGELDVYYPDYDAPSWSEGFCINTRPLPSGRPTYDTLLACCQGAYGGQTSGTCLSMLPSPPTMSPTETGPLDVFYPDYSNQASWAEGVCVNTRPLPSGRPTYDTLLACCKGAYGGQTSGACIATLPSPPTMTPTESGGLDVFYPDTSVPWSEGSCINTRPLPSGSPTFDTLLACCQGAYGGQTSGACIASLPSPPTMSPTETGPLDVFYPDYSNPSWADGVCINTRPLPSGRPTYDTLLACCQGAYGGQTSGACIATLPSPPTMSPTESGGLDVYYPDYDAPSWFEGSCINTRPLPSGRPTYDSQLACCQGAYAGQASGKCLSMLPSPPTMSPTETGPLDVFYPDPSVDWSVGVCINTRPLPSGSPTFDTQLACCKGAYGGQTSGACIADLPSPPTASPTESGGLDEYYPDYDSASWPEGVCINTRPLPSGRPSRPTQAACCSAFYSGQVSQACLCDAVGVCFSCSCGSQAERDAAGGCPDLTCS